MVAVPARVVVVLVMIPSGPVVRSCSPSPSPRSAAAPTTRATAAATARPARADLRRRRAADADPLFLNRSPGQTLFWRPLEAERDAYLAALAEEVDERGHRLVVGNGHAQARVIATGAGPIEVEAPRVNDKRVDEETGERCRFRSQILAPWCRKSPKVSEVLPLMYLHGMSLGDFAPALGQFFGSEAGLSPSVITRLTKTFQAPGDACPGGHGGRRGAREWSHVPATAARFSSRLAVVNAKFDTGFPPIVKQLEVVLVGR